MFGSFHSCKCICDLIMIILSLPWFNSTSSALVSLELVYSPPLGNMKYSVCECYPLKTQRDSSVKPCMYVYVSNYSNIVSDADV